MNTAAITPQTHIQLHPLRYSSSPNEFNEYAIVRWDTDQSISANTEAVAVIKSFTTNKSLADIAQELNLKIGNVMDIGRLCLDAGYIKQIDQEPVPDIYPKIKPWLRHVDRRWFSWILSKPLLFFSYIFIISGVYLIITHPKYLPSYQNFFWTEDYFVVIVVGELISLILLFIHEFMHFFVTKAVGGESMIRVDSRFLDLVVETNQYHLALIPKIFRYFVYGAGMFMDLLIVMTIVWIFQLTSFFQIDLGLFGSLLSAVVLFQLIGVVWEFGAFLETDMYNILSAFWSQDNLYVDTKKFLALRIKHWQHPTILWLKQLLLHTVLKKEYLASANDLRYFTDQERRQFLIYGSFYILGVCLYILLFIFVSIPITVQFLNGALTAFWIALTSLNAVEIVKSIITLFLLTFSNLMLLGILVRKLQKHEPIV